MYELFYFPGNASFAPHIVLEELDVPFKLSLVDRKTEAQKSPNFVKLNPAGRIPALVDHSAKGPLVMSEAAAICLHLAEQHPAAGLAPTVGQEGRAAFLQWIMYLTNTVQAEEMIYFYPEKHTLDETGAPALKAAQEARILDIFQLIDTALEGKTWLLGRYSLLDPYLFMVSIWTQSLSKPATGFPNVLRHLQAMAQRPAVQRAAKTEGLEALHDL